MRRDLSKNLAARFALIAALLAFQACAPLNCDFGCCSGSAWSCNHCCDIDEFPAAPAPVPRVAPGFGGTDVMVMPSTDAAGMSPGWTVRFDVAMDSLQTFGVSIAIPDAYVFNGFQALGPSGTPIGFMGLDFTNDNTPDFAIPVLASDPPNYASPDIDQNGRYTNGIDPCILMTQGAGTRFFDLEMPAGGDANPLVSFFPRAFQATLFLYPGILVNPRTPGAYNVEGMFTSVDPDSGGTDDFGGTAPMGENHMEELTVVPSAVSTIDPFVCYRGKPTRGKVCNADAPANAGASCETEGDCGGTIDVTDFCGKNRGPIGTPALLGDPLETKAFDLKKTGTLCSPGHRSDTTTIDPTTFLRSYKIKEARSSCIAGAAANALGPCDSPADCGGSACERTPKHAKEPLLSVQNELGVTAVATKKVVEYLVPTALGTGGPVSPLGATAVDSYKCYGVKFVKRRCAGDLERVCKRDIDCQNVGPCLRRFPKALSVSVDDAFSVGAKAFLLKKPTKLCLATAVDGTPPQSPTTHLLCYAAKGLKTACSIGTGLPGTACRKDVDCLDFPFPDVCETQPKTPKASGLYLANPLGVERVDRNKEVEVCFPSMLL